MHVAAPAAQPNVSEEQVFGLVKELVRDQHFKELRGALERQRYIQKKLGMDRKAIDGVGRPVLELDPYLAFTMKQIAADADGTVHGEALQDPTLIRLLKRDGIEVGVKDCGTTTARVGFKSGLDYSYQTEPLTPALSPRPTNGEGEGRPIRFRKTYA